MRLLQFFIFITFSLCCSCNRVYYSVQKEYKYSFYDSVCDKSSVFVAPKFQVFGITENDIDSVTLSAIDNNNWKNIMYSVTYSVKSNNKMRSPWDSINGVVQSDELDELNRLAVSQDSICSFFCMCDTLLPLSLNFLVQFRNGKSFRITDIITKKAPVYRDSSYRECGIYSYRVNGKKYYSQNFMIIMPGTRINLRPAFYVNKNGLFFNRRFSKKNYHNTIIRGYHNPNYKGNW